jgi:hypothetical protein
LWRELRIAVDDTLIPVMVMETVLDTPALAVMTIGFFNITALTLDTVVNDAPPCILAPLLAGVNTSAGNVIVTVLPLTNACVIFIVIVKVPVVAGEIGFVHTAILPCVIESAPPEDAHRPLAASHVVPVSQHPGP